MYIESLEIGDWKFEGIYRSEDKNFHDLIMNNRTLNRLLRKVIRRIVALDIWLEKVNIYKDNKKIEFDFEQELLNTDYYKKLYRTKVLKNLNKYFHSKRE